MKDNATKICGLLPDFEIKRLAIEQMMITPFVDHQVRVDERSGEPVISYGLGYSGYDIRIGTKFCEPVITGHLYGLDPKHVYDEQWWWTEKKEPFFLEPWHIILGETVETFRMPNDVMAICTGKSKLARVGINVNVTPLEIGWNGVLTVEITNACQLPVVIYPNEGIGQLLFFRTEQKPVQTYKGVYQGQAGLTLSRL